MSEPTQTEFDKAHALLAELGGWESPDSIPDADVRELARALAAERAAGFAAGREAERTDVLSWMREIHVGVDAWALAPVPMAEVEALIAGGAT